MKVVILYEELAPYFTVCVGRYAEKYDAEIVVIRKKSNEVAPFILEQTNNIRFVDRESFSSEALMNFIIAESPDALFCGGWAYKPYMHVCKKFRRSIPVILGFDNWWTGSLKQRIAGIAGRRYFKERFTACFVPGEQQRDFAVHIGFDTSHIRTGAYSCDVETFNVFYAQSLKSKQEVFPHRFVYVGRYSQEKGVETLWRAFAELAADREMDWELWCLGKGEVPPFEHPKIKHLGFRQPSEMGEIISSCGVFILPSTFEPWGVVVHEFATAGFPLLLSNSVGAAGEFLRDGENGFSVEAGSVAALKEAMKKIVAMNSAQLLAMGKCSSELALRITPDTWSTSLHELINLS